MPDEADLLSRTSGIFYNRPPIAFDPVIGYRLALGTNYFINDSGWYLGPEICYHWARYSEGDFDVKDLGKYPDDFETTGNMLLVQLKFGYHTGKK